MTQDTALSGGSPMHPMVAASLAHQQAAGADVGQTPAGLPMPGFEGGQGPAGAPPTAAPGAPPAAPPWNAQPGTQPFAPPHPPQGQPPAAPQGQAPPAPPQQGQPTAAPGQDAEIQILGTRVPVSELENLVRNRDLMRADYTRKTQEAAEARRQAESVRAEADARVAAAEAAEQRLAAARTQRDEELQSAYAELEAESPHTAQALRAIELRYAERNDALSSELSKLRNGLDSDRADVQLRAEMEALRGYPGFNEEEILAVMQTRGISHAEDAYFAIHGVEIGIARGTHDVIARNGHAPPVMGTPGSGPAVSPPFQGPGDIPHDQANLLGHSWDDVSLIAQRAGGYPVSSG